MDVTFGFMYNNQFFKCGDEIELYFKDGTNDIGILGEGMNSEYNEIVVSGQVYCLDDINFLIKL